ncbi:MAG: lamin tail domain-containing protein, partial [Candidatus Shapirobacteria bacterium]
IISGIKLDPKIYINEFVYNSSNGSGWIELYNGENNEINLSNWKLNDLDGYSISLSGSISSHGFKSFDINWLNKTADNYLGDTVVLQKKGLLGIYYPVDSINYNRILGQQNVSIDNVMLGKSIGRSTDGGSTWTSFSNPTKNISNTTDVTPPLTPILDLPLADAYVNGNPKQSWSFIVDADHYVYESYKTDNPIPANFIYTETNVKNNYRTVGGNQTISFYWRVKAVDVAGNNSPWSELRRINIDNTFPVITLDTYNISPTNQNITVTANTDEGSLNVGST